MAHSFNGILYTSENEGTRATPISLLKLNETKQLQNMNKLHIYSIRKHVKHMFLRAVRIIWKSIKKHVGMIEAKFRLVVTSRVEVGGCKWEGVHGKLQLCSYVLLGQEVDAWYFMCYFLGMAQLFYKS